MHVLPLAAATAAALTVTVLAATPASAQKLYHEHYTDFFTSDVYDCDGTPAQDTIEARGHVQVNLRGGIAYFVDHVSGSAITTNLDTGRTYTNVFSTSSHDHRIIDNGDGTLTIVVYAAGSSRYYDDTGRLVLKDPGQVRFAFDVDDNGTPGDPSDNIDIEDSFRIIRSSTGNSDFSDRNFCDDLRTFTTP